MPYRLSSPRWSQARTVARQTPATLAASFTERKRVVAADVARSSSTQARSSSRTASRTSARSIARKTSSSMARPRCAPPTCVHISQQPTAADPLMCRVPRRPPRAPPGMPPLPLAAFRVGAHEAGPNESPVERNGSPAPHGNRSREISGSTKRLGAALPEPRLECLDPGPYADHALRELHHHEPELLVGQDRFDALDQLRADDEVRIISRNPRSKRKPPRTRGIITQDHAAVVTQEGPELSTPGIPERRCARLLGSAPPIPKPHASGTECCLVVHTVTATHLAGVHRRPSPERTGTP